MLPPTRREGSIELRKNDLATETEEEIVIYYEGQEVGRHSRRQFVDLAQSSSMLG